MAKKQPGKSIAIELFLDEGSRTRARIPLKIIVNAHDTTESIITTVKMFYGIYDGYGVSFEDSQGNTLIASYENLSHNTTVYVRTVSGSHSGTPYRQPPYNSDAAPEPERRPSLGEPFQLQPSMLPPHVRELSHSPSRSSSRLARKRSTSPSAARGRRSASQQKPGSFSAVSRGSSASGHYSEDNGYSDSDADRSSASGSRRAKSDMLASSEISTANVLQEGRRIQTIFDSSVSTRSTDNAVLGMKLTFADSPTLCTYTSPHCSFAILYISTATLFASRGTVTLPAASPTPVRTTSSDVVASELWPKNVQWVWRHELVTSCFQRLSARSSSSGPGAGNTSRWTKRIFWQRSSAYTRSHSGQLHFRRRCRANPDRHGRCIQLLSWKSIQLYNR